MENSIVSISSIEHIEPVGSTGPTDPAATTDLIIPSDHTGPDVIPNMGINAELCAHIHLGIRFGKRGGQTPTGNKYLIRGLPIPIMTPINKKYRDEYDRGVRAYAFKPSMRFEAQRKLRIQTMSINHHTVLKYINVVFYKKDEADKKIFDYCVSLISNHVDAFTLYVQMSMAEDSGGQISPVPLIFGHGTKIWNAPLNGMGYSEMFDAVASKHGYKHYVFTHHHEATPKYLWCSPRYSPPEWQGRVIDEDDQFTFISEIMGALDGAGFIRQPVTIKELIDKYDKFRVAQINKWYTQRVADRKSKGILIAMKSEDQEEIRKKTKHDPHNPHYLHDPPRSTSDVEDVADPTKWDDTETVTDDVEQQHIPSPGSVIHSGLVDSSKIDKSVSMPHPNDSIFISMFNRVASIFSPFGAKYQGLKKAPLN